MADSGALRGRKPESVQFWLAIAAVSLIFHALLIIGIKRWVTMAVVEPNSGPIAVEFVDPVGDAEPQGEPIVKAGALKPDAKPELRSEVQPEPEIQSEPIVQSSVQPKIEKKQSTIASTPKPDRSIVPPKKNAPSAPSGQSGSSGPEKVATKENQNSSPSKTIPPVKSDDPLSNPGSGVGGSNLTTSLSLPVLRSTPGEIGGSGTAKLKLNFPTSIPFPATFALKPGEVIRAKVRFVVVGNDIQSPQVQELQPKLTGREQDALLQFIGEVLGQISVAEIVIDNPARTKSDTDWEATIELRL